MRRFAPLALTLTLLAACGGSDDGVAFKVDDEPANPNFDGFEILRGTVTLPMEVPARSEAIIGLSRDRPLSFGAADVTIRGYANRASKTLLYRVSSLAGGTYTIFVGVDLNADGKIGSGDLAGYYAGTTLLPIQQPASAMVVQVRNETTVDFGIGPCTPPACP